MTRCVECGNELDSGAKFCSACGAAQPVSDVDTRSEAAASGEHVTPANVRDRRRTTMVITAILVLVLLGGLGFSMKVQADRKAAAVSAAKEKAAALSAAKAEASEALASVEKCESAVQVGVTLNDLSSMATEARSDVAAFNRSDSSKLLPRFSRSLTAASDAYVASCGQWFTDNESAMKRYEAATDAWIKSGVGDSPDLDDFKDDSAYQQSWSDAGTALEDARTALTQATSAD